MVDLCNKLVVLCTELSLKERELRLTLRDLEPYLKRIADRVGELAEKYNPEWFEFIDNKPPCSTAFKKGYTQVFITDNYKYITLISEDSWDTEVKFNFPVEALDNTKLFFDNLEASINERLAKSPKRIQQIQDKISELEKELKELKGKL